MSFFYLPSSQKSFWEWRLGRNEEIKERKIGREEKGIERGKKEEQTLEKIWDQEQQENFDK